MATILEKIKSLNLDDDAIVTLTCEEGTDVFHFNETEIETALSETGVVESFAELISTPGLNAMDSWSGDSIIQNLRDQDLLESYERDGDFAGYLTEVINENFYDVELIDYSTEKYDHKRGFTTLTATAKVTVENLIATAPMLFGWSATVDTDAGVLTLE
tara:strand:+ start:431 stop:907 length:477 start_codon:yes stop_codon:yes gene_type:complete